MARNRRGIEEGISVQLHREAVDSTVDPAVTLPANDFAGAVGGIYALANSGMSESRSPADLCRRVLHHLIPGKRLRSAASKKESGIRCFSGISLGDRGLVRLRLGRLDATGGGVSGLRFHCLRHECLLH